MKRSLRIQREKIDEVPLVTGRDYSRKAGAVMTFLGVVRERENEREIKGLQYEAFAAMAEYQFHKLFDEMEKRWPIESIRVIHRIGMVAVQEPSLWVEVTGSHRAEVFAAGQWLIDEMKKVVPIWKKGIE